MNYFDLKDKVAVVTGGNRGIGRAIALGLAKVGAHVVVAARDEALLKQVVDEVRAMGSDGCHVPCDLNNEKEIFNLIEETEKRYGRLDILVNNAAFAPTVTTLSEETRENFERAFQVNVIAPYLLSREAGAKMIKQNWGRIINIASVAGIIGLRGQVSYCASKGALIQMTKVLAMEWAGRYNITVNAIAPGFVATDMNAVVRENEKLSKAILRRTPARRFGEANEVVGLALYLASEWSSFTNGSVLVVDGGMVSS
jgi:2-deoxy-D-gluconate 3-dehydrogenase